MTGVRAYERRPDLRANNQRLLDYAAAGGTVLVQYNKFEFNEAQYGPYPAKVSSARVTDENAPIEVLRAVGSGVLDARTSSGRRPGPDWVQERGFYFLGERDQRYVDLVIDAIRSSSTRASRPARWSKRVSARGAGCTLGLGSGASCQQEPSARTASWPT